MSYYHLCPECGASLDPGEKCDCTKENGLPDTNQNSPKRDKPRINSIASKNEKIKGNSLKDLRISIKAEKGKNYEVQHI